MNKTRTENAPSKSSGKFSEGIVVIGAFIIAIVFCMINGNSTKPPGVSYVNPPTQSRAQLEARERAAEERKELEEF